MVKMRVSVLDEDRILKKMFVYFFSQCGYTCVWAMLDLFISSSLIILLGGVAIKFEGQ